VSPHASHGYPIRISVHTDYSDGCHHESEVRGPQAVDKPDLPVHWPAAVTTPEGAKQLTAEYALSQENSRLRDDLECLLAVATIYLDSFTDHDRMSLTEKLRYQQVEEVVQRRGKRY